MVFANRAGGMGGVALTTTEQLLPLNKSNLNWGETLEGRGHYHRHKEERRKNQSRRKPNDIK